MSPAEHTPTPWAGRFVRRSTNLNHEELIVVGPSEVVEGLDGIAQADTRNDRSFAENDANMLFIIEAVNSHATLTSRIEQLEAELSAAASLFETLAEGLPSDDTSAIMMSVMAARNRAALGGGNG